jgi:hypothetical protein
MPNPAVVVDFVANTKDLSKGFDDASRKAGRFGGKVKGIGLAGAAAGFAALAGAVKLGVDEFGEAQKVGAQTDAVLKSTGDAAKVSADHISTLAESLMKKSGVDDEAIQSGENLLLTFTNIRNEAGKGNDIFDQTTKAALDMSTALGTDMKTASMQVGKALNDPIKGVTKLTRAGVTFTDAQKKQIEQMQKSGDVAGAQKVILGELTKEFGGSAEAAGKTLPGQLNILKQSFSNLAGELVGKLVPPLTAVFGFLVEHKTTVTVFAGVIGALALAFVAVSAATAAWTAIQGIITATTTAWAAAQWILNAALAANPIALVVIAIVALIAVLVIAWKNSETFRDIVTGAFNAVWDAIKAVFGWLRDNWPTVLAILTGPIGLAVLAIVSTGTRSSRRSPTRSRRSRAGSPPRGTGSGTSPSRRGAPSRAPSPARGTPSNRRSTTRWNGSRDSSPARGHARSPGSRTSGTSSPTAPPKCGAPSKTCSTACSAGSAGSSARSRASPGTSRTPSRAPSTRSSTRGTSSRSRALRSTSPRSGSRARRCSAAAPSGSGRSSSPTSHRLAQGGIVDRPTLALIGEAGPEAVVPLSDTQRPSVQVRVFIGDRELTDLVRTEITDANTGLARTLLAG